MGNNRNVQWGYGPDRRREARETCVKRRGICGQDCPYALESMGYTCSIRKISEVRRGIAEANLSGYKLSPYERSNRRSALTTKDVLLILDLLSQGKMVKEIARRMKVSSPTVRDIRDGIRWREVHREWHRLNPQK